MIESKEQKKNKYFDLLEAKSSTNQIEKNGILSLYLNKHIDKISKAEDLLRLPDEDEIFYLYTEKAFNAFTFIPYIAKTYFIDQIFASTYSISRRVVEALQNLQQNGKVGEVSLLINDGMPQRNPTTVNVLEAVVKENANFSTKYMHNHSKITLIKAIAEEKIFYYVLEGSGNWSENAQLEQYTLTNSEKVFDFYKEIFI